MSNIIKQNLPINMIIAAVSPSKEFSTYSPPQTLAEYNYMPTTRMTEVEVSKTPLDVRLLWDLDGEE